MGTTKSATPHETVRGVYMLRCNEDGRVYIGKSRDVHKRLQQHTYLLDKGKHSNRELQEAWQIESNTFVLYILERVTPDMPLEQAEDLMYERESFYQVLMSKMLYNRPERRPAYGSAEILKQLPPLVWEHAGEDQVRTSSFKPMMMPRRMIIKGVSPRHPAVRRLLQNVNSGRLRSRLI